ncbi:hypothetical protein, partial [Escherichia coli]|uniref:hypothetical protein n=1 Tax=Escherichia coli TaxID=562 RepID=UPI001A7E4193
TAIKQNFHRVIQDLLEILFFFFLSAACKQKNHLYQRWFVCRNLELPTLSSEGNWLGGAQIPNAVLLV